MFRPILKSSLAATKRSVIASRAYHRASTTASAHNRFSKTSRAYFHQTLSLAERKTAAPWGIGANTYPQTAKWDVELSNEDVEKILKGYSPKKTMEAWICSAEGPDEMGNIVFHTYRHWTLGEQIRLQIVTGDNRARITEITWETFGPDVQAPEYKAKRFAIEICRQFLGCELKGAM
ncbi:hypothetical protein CcaCcLH18_04780 [Colletotrichum camelliae]|nr:hypothetical protein CcaCcLH18_04780 [Colletotrichum camelliae]